MSSTAGARRARSVFASLLFALLLSLMIAPPGSAWAQSARPTTTTSGTFSLPAAPSQPRPVSWRAIEVLSSSSSETTEWGRAKLIDGKRFTRYGSEGLGFRSGYRSSTSAVEWVALDLGAQRTLTEVRLYPASPWSQSPGYGFPRRFRIDVSNDRAFAQFHTVADHTQADYPNPGAAPVILPLRDQGTFRYVRLWANGLADLGNGRYGLALAEIEVPTQWTIGKPDAQGDTVRVWASSTTEDGPWQLGAVADGAAQGRAYMSWSGNTRADVPEWLVMDLGREQVLGRIELTPAAVAGKPVGHGLPRRFRIDASRHADFRVFDTVVEESEANALAFVLEPSEHAYRYVRVMATQLAPVEAGRYAMALGKLRVTATPPEVQTPEERGPAVIIAGQPDPRRTASSWIAPNDPHFKEQFYLMARTGIDVLPAWQVTRGKGARVAVLDTGKTRHPDLTWSGGFDFINMDSSLDGDGYDGDATDPDIAPADCAAHRGRKKVFHGTNMAALIGARGNNGIGIVGVAPEAEIVPVRFLDDCGPRSLFQNVITALDYAAGQKVDGAGRIKHPVDVINLSTLSSNVQPCYPLLADAVKRAVDNGVAIVVAAGNDPTVGSRYPANCPGVITVGGSRFQRSSDGAVLTMAGPRFRLGPEVHVLAPGSGNEPAGRIEGLVTTGRDAGAAIIEYVVGTSGATALVSGTLALFQSVRKQMGLDRATPAGLKKMLQLFARKPDIPCTDCGAGIIDAGRTVAGAGARLATVKGNRWTLHAALDTRDTPVAQFDFGPTDGRSWTALMCDWDGDGLRTPGYVIHAIGTWFYSNDIPPRDIKSFTFDVQASESPYKQALCGDWDGDGIETAGWFGNPLHIAFRARNSNTTGQPDIHWDFRAHYVGPFFAETPPRALAGHFIDGHLRVARPGVYHDGRFVLFKTGLHHWYDYLTPGWSQDPTYVFEWHPGGYRDGVPLVGNWDAKGTDGIGLWAGGMLMFGNVDGASSDARVDELKEELKRGTNPDRVLIWH